MNRGSRALLGMLDETVRMRYKVAMNPLARCLFYLSIFVAIPSVASAFSLGPIELIGAQDRRFHARAPVYTDGAEGLIAQIGDEEDYRRARLSRYPFVDEITARVEDDRTDRARKYIYFESQRPILAPSFNLLVKATLGAGQIMENYFLALDYQRSLELESRSEGESLLDIARRMTEPESSAPKRPRGGPDPRREPGGARAFTEAPLEDADIRRLIAEERAESGDSQSASSAGAAPSRPAPPGAGFVAKSSEGAKTVYTAPNIRVEVDRSAQARPAQTLPASRSADSPVSPKPRPIRAGALMRRVEPGDRLIDIAAELGAEKDEISRYLVAIFRANKSAFIDQNLHGLRAGASLDHSGLDRELATIDKREADRIVDESFARWRAWIASKKPDAPQARLAQLDRVAPSPTPSPTPRPREPERAEEIELDEAASSPYVVHVASFRAIEPAERLLDLLESKGIASYLSPARIGADQRWIRVLTGRFRSKESAQAQAERVKRVGGLNYARALKLANAVRIGPTLESAAATLLLEELEAGERRGAYLYSLTPKGSTAILYGAFGSSSEAEEIASALRDRGYDARAVEP